MAGSPPEPSWKEECYLGLGGGSLSWPASQFQKGTSSTNPAEGREGRAGTDGLRGSGGDSIPSESHLDSQGLECPRTRRDCYVDAGHRSWAQGLALPATANSVVSPTPTAASPVANALPVPVTGS